MKSIIQARGKWMKYSITILVFAIMVSQGVAQITTTALTGSVMDKKGGMVVGADVIATNVDTNLSRSTKTNDSGEYRIEFLPVGNYSLAVSANGYKKVIQKDIVLEISEVARVDATLEVGKVDETVTVEADT